MSIEFVTYKLTCKYVRQSLLFKTIKNLRWVLAAKESRQTGCNYCLSWVPELGGRQHTQNLYSIYSLSGSSMYCTRIFKCL